MLRLTLITVVAMVIAGCSQFGKVSGSNPAMEIWTDRQPQLAAFEQWDLRARAVIRLEGQAYNIGIGWQRQAEALNLVLEAPFGQGVFRISRKADANYILRLPDGQMFEDATAEALLEQVIGWSLPISGLDYWIRGMPHPDGVYSLRVGEDGRTRSLKQDQWEIEYLSYFENPGLPLLPRKMQLSGKTVALRLVIERWHAGEFEDAADELFPDFN